MKYNKFLLILLFCLGFLFVNGCSSIQLSEDESIHLLEYIEYSNNYIESAYERNPTDAARREIEPYRARYRTIQSILQKLK